MCKYKNLGLLFKWYKINILIMKILKRYNKQWFYFLMAINQNILAKEVKSGPY